MSDGVKAALFVIACCFALVFLWNLLGFITAFIFKVIVWAVMIFIAVGLVDWIYRIIMKALGKR